MEQYRASNGHSNVTVKTVHEIAFGALGRTSKLDPQSLWRGSEMRCVEQPRKRFYVRSTKRESWRHSSGSGVGGSKTDRKEK